MAWSVANEQNGTQVAPVTAWTTVALGFTPTTGNKLIVYVAVSSNFVATVKDNNGNTLTAVVSTGSSSGGGVRAQIHAYDVPATPPTGINVTAAVAVAGAIVVQEVSGLLAGNTTAMLDGTAGTGVAATQTVPTASYSSTAANEFLVNLYTDNGETITTAAAGSYSASAKNVNTSTNADVGVFYKNSTNGSESNGFTVSGGANTGECVSVKIAFKLAAGGGGSSPDMTGYVAAMM